MADTPSYALNLYLSQVPNSLYSSDFVVSDLQDAFNAIHIIANSLQYYSPRISSYTYATLPNATTIVNNSLALVTDLGNSFWVSDQVAGKWKLMNGQAILDQSGLFSSHTGSIAKTTIKSISIPAHAMEKNDAIRVSALFTFSDSTNLKEFGIDFGGTTIYYTSATTQNQLGIMLTIRNLNSTTKQGIQTSPDFFASSSIPTSTVNTLVANNLVVWGRLAVATDTIVLNSYTIELLKI